MTTWRDVLVGFAAELRDAGLALPPDRVVTMVSAAAAVDLLDRDQVCAATRATTCASPEDVAVHDAVFARYFGRRATPSHLPMQVEAETPRDGDGGGGAEPGTPLEVAHDDEALRTRPLVSLAPDERAEARRLVAALRLDPPRRRTRRREIGGRRLDARATSRAALRHGGEPTRLVRRDPAVRPRRVVAVVDVSGSMRPWADDYLRFAYALRHAQDAEVFTVATRLTRVTAELALPDVDRAVAACSRTMPDWTSGTRLADGIDELVLGWGRRGPLRGSVVVLMSDGLERGEPDALVTAVTRLSRLARRVVWVHPRAGVDGWTPATRSLAACVPLVDELVPGGTVDDLAAVGAAISRTTPRTGRSLQHA
ncbi:VWA domain-containing protein [Mariniluteicoccus endophyticus]